MVSLSYATLWLSGMARKKRSTSVKSWPVMPTKCPSCPFNPGGDKRLVASIMARTIMQAAQVCHHPRVHGKKETRICRGQRDEQLTILFRMELIPAPTDAAFKEISDQLLGGV